MTALANSTPLREQLEYYSARAAEYDQWWLRQGRYDRGATCNAQWFSDAEVVLSALKEFRPAGRILELACGTGIWTEQLLPFASQLTAVDVSSEMLAINAARLRQPSSSHRNLLARPLSPGERVRVRGRPVSSSRVRYVQADLFDWQPTQQFDTIFFGFWLSHVPPERFTAFWELVRSCLAPGGSVFFVDSRREPTSMAVDHQPPEPQSTVHRRRLNDGREFQVYKVFYDPAELATRLRELGWKFDVQETAHYFLYGSGSLISVNGTKV